MWGRSVSLAAVARGADADRGGRPGSREADPDELFGPLDAHGAWFDAWTACGHTALVCGVAWWLSAAQRIRPVAVWRHGCCCSRRATSPGPMAGWFSRHRLRRCDVTTVLDRCPGAVRPVRRSIAGHLARGFLTQWRTTSSRSRRKRTCAGMSPRCTRNCICWGRIVRCCRKARSRSSTFARFSAPAAAASRIRRYSRPLGAEYVIVPDRTHRPRPGGWRTTRPRRCREWRCGGTRGHFRAPGSCTTCGPGRRSSSTDPQTIRRHIEELLFPARRRATCATRRSWSASRVRVARTAQRTSARPLRIGDVTAARGRRVELEVTLSAPGLVVLNQLYDPRWRVDVRSDAATRRTTPVVRTNRIMQGVFLPAGRHSSGVSLCAAGSLRRGRRQPGELAACWQSVSAGSVGPVRANRSSRS